MPLLSWIRLIDVHQNTVFEMGKNRWRARVTENRCKRHTENKLNGKNRTRRKENRKTSYI